MIEIAISTAAAGGGDYAAAVELAGAHPRLLAFDPHAVDAQLAGCAGVLLTGGGDVDPRCYGGAAMLAHEVDPRRDDFELALVRRARDRGLPTLCICRGLQVANVAFGGTLVEDIETAFDPQTAARHRRTVDGGPSERGLIPGHVVTIDPQSLLATIIAGSPILTSSRHHQSIKQVAGELRTVAATSDGIVEAVEARFASPFWLAVQWHPESTLDADGGASRSIFAAFVGAAHGFGAANPDGGAR